MAESIQLKPCPFCGGKAGIHRCADLENERMAAVMTGKYGVHCKDLTQELRYAISTKKRAKGKVDERTTYHSPEFHIAGKRE